MIKITDINPIESNSRLKYKCTDDLENDFLETLRKNKQPEVELSKAIQIRSNLPIPANLQIEIDVLTYLHKYFRSIILGNPQRLNTIIEIFQIKGWDILIHDPINNKTTKFGEELIEIFGYQNRFRGNVGRGIWLAKNINIKACPYCNAQYTIVTTKHNKEEILKLQFDHFFPKSIFPYLSVSLYNLIPSCANCNITKSSKPLNLSEHYHPYFFDLSSYAKFYLKFDPDPALLTINNVDKQNLEIEFVPRNIDPRNIVKTHNDLYHISGVYNRHQDIAEELLVIAVIHTNNLVKNQMQIKGLFPNEDYYYRYLLRNYHLSKDTMKRPLSKLTQDIARQLKLLK